MQEASVSVVEQPAVAPVTVGAKAFDQAVGYVAQARGELGALAHVLVTAEPGAVVVTAGDLEVRVEVHLAADGPGGWRAALDPRRMAAARALGGTHYTLAPEGSGLVPGLAITGHLGTVTSPGLRDLEYPPPPELPTEPRTQEDDQQVTTDFLAVQGKVRILPDEWALLASYVADADQKPHLAGVRMDEWGLTAADGARLLHRRLAGELDWPDAAAWEQTASRAAAVVTPARAAHLLARSPWPSEAVRFAVVSRRTTDKRKGTAHVAPTLLRLEAGCVTIWATLKLSAYPPYRLALPPEHWRPAFELPRRSLEQLRWVARAASSLETARDGRRRWRVPVPLHVAPDAESRALHLSTRDPDGGQIRASVPVVPLPTEGDPAPEPSPPCAFQPRFLAILADTFQVAYGQFRGGAGPSWFVDAPKDWRRCVAIMPVRMG